MSEGEAGTVGIVMLVDDSVPVLESIRAQGELFDVFIDFVEAGGVVGELKVVSTDGNSGRSEGGKGKGLHH